MTSSKLTNDPSLPQINSNPCTSQRIIESQPVAKMDSPKQQIAIPSTLFTLRKDVAIILGPIGPKLSQKQYSRSKKKSWETADSQTKKEEGLAKWLAGGREGRQMKVQIYKLRK
eukprot:scaffold220972_cov10-Tisochrysis_lutea.AAC.1